jgi:hypothetical protein
MRRVVLFGTLWAALSGPAAHAQSWIDQVFPERSFDFGTVAKGSKVRHSFKVVNRLDQDVSIVDWRTKCGCTDVRVGAKVIPPGAQTVVEAVIDTTKFVGHKPSGLTLVLDKPVQTEVDLNFSCFIRGDITVTPGVVDFQNVERSRSSKPTVTLSLDYNGGMSDWGILKMQTRTRNVAAKATLTESSRSPGGPVHYTLSATLDPSDLNGFFKDEITLYTNDSTSPTIPISVVANVRAAVTVSPSNLVLGPVKAGQVIEKTLLVRSSKPFKVTGVKTSKDDDFTTTPDPDDSRQVHTVKVKFKAPSKPGAYNATFEIATDLKDEPPARMTTYATILP